MPTMTTNTEIAQPTQATEITTPDKDLYLLILNNLREVRRAVNRIDCKLSEGYTFYPNTTLMAKWSKGCWQVEDFTHPLCFGTSNKFYIGGTKDEVPSAETIVEFLESVREKRKDEVMHLTNLIHTLSTYNK